MNTKAKKRILVAPLNWGLGHATRCIPIINALKENDFEPVIASDGAALTILKKEFSDLSYFELPSYNITYSKKGNHFRLKMLKNVPHIIKTIRKEKKFINQLIKSEQIDGIISDNRFGIRHKSVPSVFITHQLKVLSGNTTWFSTKLHQKIISKFKECWVPDYKKQPNLSGSLGHPKHKLKNIKYIGPLSRFEKQNITEYTDLLVLLSGPEPQRSQLEDKLLTELKNYSGKVIFIRGLVTKKQETREFGSIKIYNYMLSCDLEKTINSSKLILSRSGYTTIMDLAKLGKKAIFIPTPGQFEQLYLAEKLDINFIAQSYNQDEFTVKDLKYDNRYSGFNNLSYRVNYKDLFRLF